MALTQISFPAEEASDWTDFIDMVKDWIVGHIRCSLTNYDADTAPALAIGSTIEMNGSYYYAATEQSISGTPTTDSLNYIYLDDSAYTLSWSNTAPTWSDAKHGFYNGNDRAIGGCYYDGTNYIRKWIYRSQDTGPVTRYITQPHIGQDATTNLWVTGNHTQFSSISSGTTAIGVWGLKDDMIITEFNIYIATYSSGTLAASLRRGDRTGTGFTTMASLTESSGGSKTDSTITSPRVDTTQYEYYIVFSHSAGTSSYYISGARVQVIEIIR